MRPPQRYPDLLAIGEPWLRRAVRRHATRAGRDVDDLAQEARVALVRAQARYDRVRAAPETFVARVVERSLRDQLARASRRPDPPTVSLRELLDPEGPVPDLPDPAAPDPERLALAREVRAHLDAEVGRLPATQRALVVLVYGWDGDPPRSVCAAARELGITRDRAITALRRAHRALRGACQVRGWDVGELLRVLEYQR